MLLFRTVSPAHLLPTLPSNLHTPLNASHICHAPLTRNASFSWPIPITIPTYCLFPRQPRGHLLVSVATFVCFSNDLGMLQISRELGLRFDSVHLLDLHRLLKAFTYTSYSQGAPSGEYPKTTDLALDTSAALSLP